MITLGEGPVWHLNLLPDQKYEFRDECNYFVDGKRPVVTVNSNNTLSWDTAAYPSLDSTGTTLKFKNLVPLTVDMTGYEDQPGYDGIFTTFGCTPGEQTGPAKHDLRLMRGGSYFLNSGDSFGAVSDGSEEPVTMLNVSTGGALSLVPTTKSFKIVNGNTLVPNIGYARIGRGSYTGPLCALIYYSVDPNQFPFRCAGAGEELEVALIRERNYYIGSTTGKLLIKDSGACSVSSINVGGATLPVRCGLAPPPPLAPVAPGSFSAKPRSKTRVELSWTDLSDNEASFQIDRKLPSASNYTTIATLATGTTHHFDDTVVLGTTYNYRVRAVNVTASAASAVATVTVAAPPTPAGLTAKQTGPGRVNLSWTDLALEDGYVLLRSTDGATFPPIAILPANTTSFSDGEAMEGITNLYRVASYNAVDTSPPSNPPVSVPVTAPVQCGGTGPACPEAAFTQFNHNTSRIDYRQEPGAASGLALDGLGRGVLRDASAGEVLVRPSTNSCVGSRVDNLRWSFSQESVDFSTGPEKEGAPSGCAPSASRDGPLPPLQLRRYHRPRLEHTGSFFGPGAFSNFDTKLTYYRNGLDGHPNVVLFNPETDAPALTFFERSVEDGDDADDGILFDTETRKYRDMYFYADSPEGGGIVADMREASWVYMDKNDGGYVVFEPIQTNAGSPNQIEARPAYFVDASGNFFWVGYQFNRDATDAELGYDRSQLWKVSYIWESAHDNSMYVDYEHRPSGRWLVSKVTTYLADGTPRVHSYAYSDAGGAVDTLTKVTYPNGDVSQFSKTFDATTQLWGLTYDDVGGGSLKLKKTVWVTGSTFKTTDGKVHGQTPNLVRRVVNATGEEVLRLRENPNNPKVTFAVEGNRKLSRLSVDANGAPREVARARAVTTDPMTATYDGVESYVTDSKGTIEQATDALGKVRTLVHDTNRRVTGLTARDGTTASWTFDWHGRPTSSVDRAGRLTAGTYDDRGNLLTWTEAPGTSVQATTQYTYDLNTNRILTRQDPLGRITTYGYDSRSYPASVTEPPDSSGGARATSTMENGDFGLLLSRTDALGHKTSYQYDTRNRLVATTYPDGTKALKTYGTGTLAGVVVSETDRNGVTTTYEYDATHRLTRSSGRPTRPRSQRSASSTWPAPSWSAPPRWPVNAPSTPTTSATAR